MTRATQVTRAISAARKVRSTPSSPDAVTMTFLIDEDNGGGYHWMLVADGDEVLVRSEAFGSYEEAKQAASIVHDGGSRASFGHHPDGALPGDLPARRHAAAERQRVDAERWLDDGGHSAAAANTGEPDRRDRDAL